MKPKPKLNLPKQYFSKLMRAIVEFNMLKSEDKILIGLSGGKDSLFLLYALAFLKTKLHDKFSLYALNIDPMFNNSFSDTTVAIMEEYCSNLNIPFTSIKTDIYGAIKNQKNKKPCFTCSYFRRGAVNRYAKEIGCNKIAYAHHKDDAVETFFMSLIYSGQLETFSPVTYLNRTDLTVIRPLVYFREYEIEDAIKLTGFTTIKNPCPFDGNTKRQRTKEIIKSLSKDIKDFYPHLESAMRESALGDLWPNAKTKNEMKVDYFKYIKGEY